MITELYEKLRNLKINVELVDDKLDIQAPRGILSPELLDEIKYHKDGLVDFIKTYKKGKYNYNSISPIEKHNSYPLSSSQRRLWVLSQIEEGNIAYNMPGVYVFEGNVNYKALEQAFIALLERHEILRTVFKENEQGEVKQFIQLVQEIGFNINYQDLRYKENREQEIKRLVQAEFAKPFNLSIGPLISVGLLHIEDRKWIFTYVMHHIISDGWSMEILIKELLHFYNVYTKGEANNLTPLHIQYKDYAVWQQKQLAKEELQKHKNYWLEQFQGELPVLELPTNKPRPAIRTYNGGTINRIINIQLTNKIKALSYEQGCTLFMGLSAVVNTLLYRYTNQEDIIIGTPTAGRENTDLENQIGFYVNTLALRTKLKSKDSFKQLLNNIKQVTLGAYDNQVYPFDELIDELQINRDRSRNVLFDVMVALQNNEARQIETLDLGEIKIKKYTEVVNRVSKFDLVFNFIEAKQALQLNIDYNSDIYNKSTIEELANHFEQLLLAIIENPIQPLYTLDYLSEKEKNQLLLDFNDTTVDYPRGKTLVELLEEQVKEKPSNLALVYGEKNLTYKEVNELSNQLAHYLRTNYNIQPNDLIAVKLERSEWMVIGIVAVLKSGAAFVPIDPEYPQERIDYMIADSRCKLVVDNKELRKFKEEEKKYSKNNLTPLSKSKNLAQVIYTSGTTGKPKGVLIEHESLSARMNYLKHAYNLSTEDNLIFYRSYSFDGTIEEYLLPLIVGAKCFIAPADFKQDLINNMIEFIERNKISKINIPPILLTNFIQIVDNNTLQRLSSLKHIICGGDELTKKIIIGYFSKFTAKLYNTYGPSENTIDSTSWEARIDFATNMRIPIGKPIQNAQVYILDDNLQIVPIGICGELYVGGSGLSRGYLNQSDLTKEKFIPNPFKKGEQIYKTGDLGRWLPDGNIEFIGRKDEQVKIRGYRIELGEIEATLQKHQHIEIATVVAKANQEGNKELIAYIVTKEVLNPIDIRAYLSNILPAYMLPSYYILLDKLPLTPNGKVDKRKLPSPEELDISSGVEYLAPSNIIERHLVEVYQDVLKKQPIGIKEDFFVLGGDSIKAIQVISRLKQYGYGLNIRDIMTYPVIQDLASKVYQNNRCIEQEIVEGRVPLSPIQIYFFQNNIIDVYHYNQSVLLQSKIRLHESGLRAVLEKIVLHHDALRMLYRKTDEGWIQENKGKEQAYNLEIIEVVDDTAFNTYCQRTQSSINLEKGPLFKVVLFRNYKGYDRLLIVCHHLVIDGVSWRILFEDLANLYQQYLSGEPLTLPLKTHSFKYWQEKQLDYSKSQVLQKEEKYWSVIEAIDIKPLLLDDVEGSNLIRDISLCSFSLDESLTEQLLTQCYKSYRTEINEILLTALTLALKELFGLEKVLIKMEGHGREHIESNIDITRTIGWFTTMYPVVFDINYSQDIIRQLIEVKEYLHRIPNRGIGYGILRYITGKKYKLKPEITFNYLGDFGEDIQTKQGNQLFEFLNDYRGNEISENMQRDSVLNISGIVVKGKMHISIRYSNKQFTTTTIERLTTCYQQNLLTLIKQLKSSEREHLTPSDLTYKGLSVEQIQELDKTFNIEDIYPLTPLQEGLYYHWISSPDSPAYFQQMSYRLKGSLDICALEKSYQALVSRYAILRTCFVSNLGETTLQIVQKEVASNFTYKDISKDVDFCIDDYKKTDRAKGFDLHAGSQMRLTVLDLGDNNYEFIWSHHHILMDGWCSGVLIKEFFQIYDGLIQNKPLQLNKVYQYSNYLKWLETVDKNQSLNYWKHYLSDYNTISSIPKTTTNQSKQYDIQERTLSIEGNTRQSIKALCAKLSITENTFMQTVWGVLLSKYNNTDDVVFGAVVSGRPGEIDGIEEMMGLCINTIPVRIRSKETTIVKDLLKKIHNSFLEGTNHHYIQLAQIQSASELGQNLFDHIMVLENYPVQEMIEQGIKIKDSKEELLTLLSSEVFDQTNYDFIYTVIPRDTITIKFKYNGKVYDEKLVNQLQNHLLQIVNQILENPAITIPEINCLSEEEKHQLLLDFNNTAVDYSKDRTIVNMFEEQASKTPTNIAIAFEETTLTYKELDEKSNQLSHYLIKNYNVDSNSLVGVMVDRSEKMVIAILGILKSGAAYVPIDADYPKARKEYIINDTRIKALVTQTEYIFDLEYYNGNVFAIDVQLDVLDTSSELPKIQINSNDLAYIIYTSGTTGNPKGCTITHSNLSNYIQWANDYYFKSLDNPIFSLYTSLSFDLTVTSLFCPLTKGGQLYIYKQHEELSKILLHSFNKESNINSIKLTPSHINALKHLNIESSNIQIAIVGGEAVTAKHVNILKSINPFIAIHNEYGPTESTVGCIVAQLEENRPILIGKPIANAYIYILDKECMPCPMGVPGEIYIGGAGLAKGYLNQPDLTAEKFIPNPFQQRSIIYKTGDLGRWLLDGNIEYIGRKDEQVKIRGHRIELGEIEATLQKHQHIDSVVVVARTNKDGEEELVGYIVSKEALNTLDIRSYLNKALPVYMIPSHFVQLEIFPLTSNGKLDKRRLPDPEGLFMETGVAYIAPRNETEKKMVNIWQEILDREKIGIKDSFFELSGDSIKVLRLINALKKELNIDIPVADVYKHNTVEKIIDHIAQNKDDINQKNKKVKEIETAIRNEMSALKERIFSSNPLLKKEDIEDIYLMSAIEKGMVFGSLLNEDSGVYHDQFVNQVTFFDFNLERFRLALELLIEKHSIMRTSFNLNDYETEVQIVYKKVESSIQYKDISKMGRKEQENEIRDFLKMELKKPFKISVAPLWKMSVFNIGEHQIVFVFQFHHAIIDGWSRASFQTELNNLYLKLGEDPSYKPDKLKSSYKDFIIQSEANKKNDLVEHFWRTELSNYTRLDLFTEEEESKKYSLSFDNKYLERLERVAIGMNVTVKTLSLSAYLYMLKILSYDKEIVVGLVANNRPICEDNDKIIGCFLNTIPLKVTIDGSVKGSDFVNYVSDKLIELKSKESLSLFEISKIHSKEKEYGNPFFDVLFDYLDFHAYKAIKNDVPTKEIENSEYENDFSFGRERTNTHFDFTINVTGGFYHVSLRLSKKLKSGISLEKIGELYFNILNYIVDNPEHQLKKLNYLSLSERNRILFELNGTQVDFPEDAITTIIEKNASKQPNSVAIRYKDNSITYKQLNENSNRLARFMMQRSLLQLDDLIAIITERNDTFIENVLSVWKTGAAYLPIDPEDPILRINNILEDSEPKLIITDNANIVENLEFKSLDKSRIIFLPSIQDELKSIEVTNLKIELRRESLAYVIYTSGSTGRPKGAMVEHIGMMNHMYAKINDLKIDSKTIIAQNASQCFDISVWQSFAALVAGGTTVIYDKETVLNPNLFISRVKNDKVILLELVPSYLSMIIDLIELGQVQKVNLENLQYMILTGEALKRSLLEKWFRHYASIPIMNAYGPTEASDDITHYIAHTLPESKNIPIGKPVQNFNIYIVNEMMNLCPIGVKGEIVVSGIGVGRGYLNNAEKTNEVFLNDPFNADRKMYKTGDLGRILEDGNIEFLGRKDYQLKIKGFRIELEEIEVNLGLSPTIKESVVVDCINEQGEPYLVAYYTSDIEIETNGIKSFLRDKLPDYMVPSYFIKLSKLPLNSNGKIDRKVLKTYDVLTKSDKVYVEPKTPLEKKLAKLWKELFSIDKISTSDNFFDLGGDSFKAIRLVSKSDDFSISDLYNNPTIAELAEFIEDNHPDNTSLLSLMLDTKDKAKLSFIGIPNSAGDPFSFNETILYLQQYTDDINFYGVKLPRVEPAQNQDMETMLKLLSAELASEIRNKIKTPIIIFGQCNGSALTISVADILQKEKFDIKAICVGGILPPKKTNFNTDRRTNNDILKFIKSLNASIPNDPLDQEFFLKNFRYDSNFAKAGFNYYTTVINQKGFEKFKMPLFFITGNHDPLTKGYKRKYKRWYKYAEHVEMKIIDNAGHYLLRDVPDELAKILQQIAFNTIHNSVKKIR